MAVLSHPGGREEKNDSMILSVWGGGQSGQIGILYFCSVLTASFIFANDVSGGSGLT